MKVVNDNYISTTGKLLIVEDEYVIAQDLRRICMSLGYAVMGMAKSATEAISKIKKEKPDLILLDVNIIGDLNGIELAKIIKEKFQLPYIFITSYSDTNTIKEIDATHPLGYILKPYDERDIRVALELAFTKANRITSSIGKPNQKIVSTTNVYEVLGESDSIKSALKKARQVAPTDVTVLLSGETGTGKELFMHTVHKLSARKNKKIVKVNCAALPNELVESILFGHEKGSFTGAIDKKIGKFELANNGTLFLDEIGELSLSIQAKLLRCIQEKEIEPIGSQETKKVDVRIITATNRNLAEEVDKGNFRADLFFRLNIFPIHIPPLRKRGKDIELLANHFLKIYNNRLNKNITEISEQTINDFNNYNWPGNVRELQYLIERGVILSEDNDLTIEIDTNSSIKSNNQHEDDFHLKSMAEVEREQIIKTLYYCKGKVRGKGGAAEILKLHPNTLDFRIKKLGIKKVKDYKAT